MRWAFCVLLMDLLLKRKRKIMKNIINDLVSFYKNHKVKAIILGLVFILCLILSWKMALTILIIIYVYLLWKKNSKNKKDTKDTKGICPHCKEEINSEASICPHCHGKIYQWTIGRKILVGFIIIIAIVLVVSSSPDNKNTSSVSNSTTKTETPTEDRKIISIVFAKKTIEDILKSPSTAKFVDVQAYELSSEKDVWAVNGYVDSQNSYGAMIRNQWEVQLDYRDGKGGTIKSILFDGKKMQ